MIVNIGAVGPQMLKDWATKDSQRPTVMAKLKAQDSPMKRCPTGMTASASLWRWKPLTEAPAEARNRWRLTDDPQGVRWDVLDVEIYSRLLLD